MTDYKNLKLIASSSPHPFQREHPVHHAGRDHRHAARPGLERLCFGLKALLLTAVSVVACVFWEWLYRKLHEEVPAIGDLSAVVTGMLLAFVCPATCPGG